MAIAVPSSNPQRVRLENKDAQKELASISVRGLQDFLTKGVVLIWSAPTCRRFAVAKLKR